MPRKLDETLLDKVARHYSGQLFQPDRKSDSGNYIFGPKYVMNDLYNLTFKDEQEFVLKRMRDYLGKGALQEFDRLCAETFTPRDDKVFAELLKTKLAIDMDGNHIEGVVGTTDLGRVRVVDRYAKRVKLLSGAEVLIPKAVYWPVYAGEGEERAAGRIREKIGVGPGADPLPEGAEPLPVGANVTNFSAEAIIAALDAIRLRLDEGTTAAEIRGRTGAQPADPDAAETGTLLFTCPCSDPAVNAAVDDTDGSCSATFDTITDDTGAAGGTCTYCRVAATGTGADDHIDGNAGTVDEAFVFNTNVISAGATVSITAASTFIGMSQGSTAT